MNILFISLGLDPTVGGTERVTRTLMTYFERNGINCYITYCLGEDATFPPEKKMKVNYRGKYSVFSQLMTECIKAHQIDLIINENICEINVSRFFKELKKTRNDIPIIYCLHNTPEIFIPRQGKLNSQRIKNILFKFITGKTIYMWKHKRMYDIADRYVVLSPSYISQFYNIFNIKEPSKVIAIPNPVTMSAKGTKKENKENIFLVVARLADQQKNISAILRIWKEFTKQDHEYKLQIVGSGPDEEKLKKYAEFLKLRDVEFTGKTNEPQKYYKHAKFFLMTSRYEGFPMTIIEAIQFGCIPIVMDSFSAINDVIESGKNGILVPSGDERMFVESMHNVVADDSMRNTISGNLESSLQKYAVGNVGEQWKRLFNQLTSK